MKYYIASKLENADQVRRLKAHLDGMGWTHTYDWTVHGSVQRQGHDVIEDVAQKEVRGVRDADVVIVLLPGGRGTHVELGIGLITAIHVIVYSENAERDFGDGGDTCAFYHHPNVCRVSSWGSLIDIIENGIPR